MTRLDSTVRPSPSAPAVPTATDTDSETDTDLQGASRTSGKWLELLPATSSDFKFSHFNSSSRTKAPALLLQSLLLASLFLPIFPCPPQHPAQPVPCASHFKAELFQVRRKLFHVAGILPKKSGSDRDVAEIVNDF